MSAPFFAETWERAKARRAHQRSKLRAFQPLDLRPCALDPLRSNLNPALELEQDLLTLDEETFNSLAPDHARQLERDRPAETGIAWIDKLERELYGED